MTVIEIIKAAVISLAAMGVIYYIAYKATDYTPGDLTKAANEFVEAKNEIADLEKQLRQIDGNALITDWANRFAQTARDAALDSEKMVSLASKYENKLVGMYRGEKITPEERRVRVSDGRGGYVFITPTEATSIRTDSIGNVLERTKYTIRCRCAYCDTINDHETGVCDRCGAPLP